MSDQARLEYHRAHSLAQMESIKHWCEAQREQPTFEEHSSLGKAINYFLNHYWGLTRFCYVLGAQIDNNRTEETLKNSENERFKN